MSTPEMRLPTKKGRRVVSIIAALVAAMSCATNAPAQTAPVAGGYAETSPTSAEVVTAARHAAREQALKESAIIFVDSVKSAEVQVVAGLNYRLSMRVVVYDKPAEVRAVVHRNLEGEYSLSSWEAVGTPAAGSVSLPSLYSDSAVEQLMKALDEAYNMRAMGRLDARRSYPAGVRVVIEHSISGRFERRRFRTLAQAERWLRSREREDGTPFRETRPLEGCGRGTCAYDFNGGILHNHLYLHRVSYGLTKGRPYIKTIYLLDGD